MIYGLDSLLDLHLGNLHLSDLVGLGLRVLAGLVDGTIPGVLESVLFFLAGLAPLSGLALGGFQPLLFVLLASLSQLFVFKPLVLRRFVKYSVLGHVVSLPLKVANVGVTDHIHLAVQFGHLVLYLGLRSVLNPGDHALQDLHVLPLLSSLFEYLYVSPRQLVRLLQRLLVLFSLANDVLSLGVLECELFLLLLGEAKALLRLLIYVLFDHHKGSICLLLLYSFFSDTFQLLLDEIDKN
mmetsp:Transcript_15363/g.31306  ORF Transcript_15363/g.31306 Transcript_15363/m.31306 type:complete len:239 (+) Transcript_15363:4351-5067(+)